MRNYRLKEGKTPDGRSILTGTEDQEQEKVFTWAQYAASGTPELALLYHVPNGGSRNRVEAAKLKRMGVKPGVPDMVLPVPRGGYAGLYIELKVGKNRPTKNQNEWLLNLTLQGYLAEVCYGGDEAIEKIREFLKLPMTELGRTVKA